MTGLHYKTTRKIILTISILLIISSIFVIGLILKQTRKQNEAASKFQLEQSIQRVSKEFGAYFAPIDNALVLFAEYGKTGLFEDRKEENIVAKFLPFLDKVSDIEYISLASEDGYFIIINKGNPPIETKQINSIEDSVWTITQWNSDLERVDYSVSEFLPSTDSILSQLFLGDIQEDTIIGSPIRYFFETSGIGVNYGIFYQSRVSGKKYRISIGVLLSDFAEWIDSQRVGSEGRVSLFDYKGRIFRPQKIDTNLDEVQDSLYLMELDSSIQSLEFTAISQWKELSNEEDDNFRFKYNNEYWWAGMLPLDRRRNTSGVWLGVIVPENDLLQFMQGSRGFVIIGFLIILLASIITITTLIIRSSRADSSKSGNKDQLEDEEAIYKTIKQGEGDRLEFKSTVRQNLHTGKPGKEIEIAWLKGVAAFLNSEGGILLIGVNDDGEVVGFDPDNFASDDRCLLHIQNLIKQHIGLEFSPYIAIKINKLKQGKIVSISCSPSKVPVFLKNNDKEQFFVRSGPSSVELSVSRALKYIEDRKKNS